MNDVVLTVLPGNSDELWLLEHVGILIINDQHELLLHKRTPSITTRPIWESPYLLQRNTIAEKPYDAASRFLANLGVEGELHEAFTSMPKRPHTATKIVGHLIIALTSAEVTQQLTKQSASKCVAIEHVIADAHEHPEHYAQWFRNSLDGVSLYLKNLLKQSRLPLQEQAELS
jgi:hypothetical protein